MQPFKFNYTDIVPNNFGIDIMINHYKKKYVPPKDSADSYENLYQSNVLLRFRDDELKSLEKIRELISSRNFPILPCIDDCLKYAENDGILGCYDIMFMISGNCEGLPFRKGVNKHCHARVQVEDMQVYTLIYPLKVKELVTDYIWAKWFDDEYEPLSYGYNYMPPFEERIRLQRVKMLCAEKSTYEPVTIKFPDANELLKVEFNGSHWLHSVEETKNNLYFVMVINDASRRTNI